MDPRLFLRLPLGQTSTGMQYFVNGQSAVAASRLTSSEQYYTAHQYYYQHHQQQRHWDAMVSLWNPQTATSHDRKLFSIDSIMNHSNDIWRTDHESVSRLETSDLSGKFRRLLVYSQKNAIRKYHQVSVNIDSNRILCMKL